MFKSSTRLVDIPNSGLNSQIFLIFFPNTRRLGDIKQIVEDINQIYLFISSFNLMNVFTEWMSAYQGKSLLYVNSHKYTQRL